MSFDPEEPTGQTDPPEAPPMAPPIPDETVTPQVDEPNRDRDPDSSGDESEDKPAR